MDTSFLHAFLPKPSTLFRVAVLIIVVCCCGQPGSAQSCLPCIVDECPQINSSSCPYGVVKDYCHCCDTCVKGPGEKCGGFYGQCFNGSRCLIVLEFGSPYIKFLQATGKCEDISKSSSSTPAATIPVTPSFSTISHMAPSSTTSLPPVAITPTTSSTVEPSSSSVSCHPTPPTPPPVIHDQKCRTACSKQFCYDGLNRYCSSNSSFSTPRNPIKERVPCQHTTCLACKFVVKPKCPTCPVPVTKRCLRHFELCLDEHYKRSDIFLEMTDPRIATSEGEIVCDIPELLIPEEDGEGSG